MLHQLVEHDVGVVDLRADSVDYFAEIVRRYVSRHPDCDSGSAVDEQIWKGRWKNSRLGARLVVIWEQLARVLLHVGHERGAEMRHARFGITHRRGRIAFDRAEIPLAVDEYFTHRPWLGHVDERGINYSFTVRVIISAGVATNLGTLTMLSPRKERKIVHRIENSALRWLESIARVRQRA